MKDAQAIFREMGFNVRTASLPPAVVYSIGRTAGLMVRELSAVYRRFGLTAASFNLLMLLKHGQDPQSFSQQTIGARLVASPSDISGLLDRLEQKRLVRRVPGRDRRSKLLQITPQGAKLLDDIWPHHLQAIARLTQALSDQQARGLVQALSVIRQAAPA